MIGTSELRRGKASKRNHHGSQDRRRGAVGIITPGIPSAEDGDEGLVSTTKSETRNQGDLPQGKWARGGNDLSDSS
jgi:hypothetical protein